MLVSATRAAHIATSLGLALEPLTNTNLSSLDWSLGFLLQEWGSATGDKATPSGTLPHPLEVTISDAYKSIHLSLELSQCPLKSLACVSELHKH